VLKQDIDKARISRHLHFVEKIGEGLPHVFIDKGVLCDLDGIQVQHREHFRGEVVGEEIHRPLLLGENFFEEFVVRIAHFPYHAGYPVSRGLRSISIPVSSS
jgi:hypothetical protein